MARRLIITPEFVIDNMDVLRKSRNDKGFSRQKLAALTGVNMGMIVLYENEAYLPKKDNYNKLAHFFGWELWQ